MIYFQTLTIYHHHQQHLIINNDLEDPCLFLHHLIDLLYHVQTQSVDILFIVDLLLIPTPIQIILQTILVILGTEFPYFLLHSLFLNFSIIQVLLFLLLLDLLLLLLNVLKDLQELIVFY